MLSPFFACKWVFLIHCSFQQSPVAFPGMLNLPGILQKTFQESEDCQAEKMKQGEDTEEAAEVEEIDDDEESLKA